LICVNDNTCTNQGKLQSIFDSMWRNLQALGVTKMRPSGMKIAAIAATGALLAASTAASAAPAAPAQQAAAPSAWLILSTLSPTADVAVGGTATAAQPAEAGPPPPPPPVGAAPAFNGEIIPFILWFALIAIALGISGESGRPNSPA
jgi:hypothetical protein